MSKLGKKHKNDIILVFDRYFSKPPRAVLSVLKKTVYCCAECVCMMFCLLDVYFIEVNPLVTALCCVCGTAAFCVLFGLFRKRIVIPAAIVAGALVLRFNTDAVWGKFKYFVDAVLVALDGRVFHTRAYMWHGGWIRPDEIIFTVAAISLVMSAVCAGAMFKKPSAAAPIAVFSVLIVPMIAAQKLSFNPWLIPTAALLLGQVAASRGFSGEVIRRAGEKTSGFLGFDSGTIERAKLENVRYSKYFSAGISAAAILAAAGIAGAAIMHGRVGIDYSGIYDFFAGMGKETTGTTTHGGSSGGSVGSQVFDEALGVSSPENSDFDVIKVMNTGNTAYLRGNIGVYFNGNEWSSAADARYSQQEPFCLSELNTFLTLKWSGDSRFDKAEIPEGWDFYEKSELRIDYLCDTEDVFLPCDISEFPERFRKSYRISGDYVLRKDARAKDPISVVAYIPTVNYSGKNAEERTEIFRAAEEISSCFDYNDWCVDSFRGRGVYNDYLEYIDNMYLSVPENLRGELLEFMQSEDIYRAEFNSQTERYELCVMLTDYLKNNYTYSLDADNGAQNPVMTFLTQTKSGHCALYASAMTLMLRTMGIPARYCTGFVAPHTYNQSMTVLNSRKFHAWCEVHFENIGWVTFDPTGGAAGVLPDDDPAVENVFSAPSESSSSDSEISSDSSDAPAESESADESIVESEPNESESSGTGAVEKEKPDVFWFVLAAVLASALSAALIIFVCKFKKLDKAAKNALENAKTSGSCEEIYAKIIAILELCGFRQNVGELPESFFLRADRHFKTKLSKHSRTLLKIAFANGGFGAKERREAAELLSALFAAADMQLVASGRIKLRKIALYSQIKRRA